MPRNGRKRKAPVAVPGDTQSTESVPCVGDDDQDVTAIIDRMLSVCERVPEPLRTRMWSLLVANGMGFRFKAEGIRPRTLLDRITSGMTAGEQRRLAAIADASGGTIKTGVTAADWFEAMSGGRQIGDYSVLRWDWPPAPAKLMPEL